MCDFNANRPRVFFLNQTVAKCYKQKIKCICDCLCVCLCPKLSSSFLSLIFWVLVASLEHYDTDIQTRYAGEGPPWASRAGDTWLKRSFSTWCYPWSHTSRDTWWYRARKKLYLAGMKWPSRSHVKYRPLTQREAIHSAQYFHQVSLSLHYIFYSMTVCTLRYEVILTGSWCVLNSLKMWLLHQM